MFILLDQLSLDSKHRLKIFRKVMKSTEESFLEKSGICIICMHEMVVKSGNNIFQGNTKILV